MDSELSFEGFDKNSKAAVMYTLEEHCLHCFKIYGRLLEEVLS